MSYPDYGTQPPQPALPPMGWYPDPAGSDQERYWDGTGWTNNLRPVPTVAAAPQHGVDAHQPQRYDASVVDPYGAAVTGPATADGVALGGFLRRTVAAIVDKVIVFLPIMVWLWFTQDSWGPGLDQFYVDIMNGHAGQITDAKYGLSTFYYTMTTALMAIDFVYGWIFLRVKGATLGQSLLGLRVVPDSNGRYQGGLGSAQAVIRQLAFVVLSVYSIVLAINWILIGVTPKRQGLHDMLARTQVIQARR